MDLKHKKLTENKNWLHAASLQPKSKEAPIFQMYAIPFKAKMHDEGVKNVFLNKCN